MLITKIFQMIIIVFLIPTILGMLITRKMEKYKNSIILSWILGHMIEFGLFEFLSVPISLITDSFMPLLISWALICAVLDVVSILINKNRFIEIIKVNIEEFKKLPIILTIIAVLLVGIQTYVPFRYMHLDDDDSNFVAKAVVTYQTKTLYKYNDMGEINKTKDLRHELATFPIYTAALSVLLYTHPTILAHTIMPCIFIPMAYLIYTLIANNLFNGDKKKVAMFIIFLSLIFIWGFYSLDTNFCFLLYRIWQGKAILANIIIPLLWLLYMDYSNEGRKNIYWFAIILTVAGANLLSSMSIVLPPLTLLALTIAYFIKDRKLSDFPKSAVSILPSAICGLIYLILK